MRGTFKFATLAMLVLAVVGLCSCGGNKTTNVQPQPLDNPGTGSRTIWASVSMFAYDAAPGSFVTNYTATLRDTLNQPITNATVTFTHANLGTINLVQDTSLFPGTYRTSTNGYFPGRYNFSAIRGTDSISGAYFNALDFHTIAVPTPNDTLRMGNSFEVQWNRTSRADTAEVETRDFAPEKTADDGSFIVPNSPNARNDQRIRVRRYHSLLLAGGYTGSSKVTLIIENSVEPLVVQ